MISETNGEKCAKCYREGKTYLMRKIDGGFGAYCPNCNGHESLPEDYETCSSCGYDHSYEVDKANEAHKNDRD